MEKGIMRPAFGAILVIIMIAGLMVPFITEMNDNIVEKNENPEGRYLLSDANTKVIFEVTSDGVMINGITSNTSISIMDTGLIKINNGRISLFDNQNEIYMGLNNVGDQLILDRGEINYSISGTDYTMTYSELLYPSSKGDYSAYNGNTTINASNGDPVYVVTWETPLSVSSYVDGVRSYEISPIEVSGTSSGNPITDFEGELTFTASVAQSEDGKSWKYTGGVQVANGETGITSFILAPRTYDTIGSMGMVITLTELMPLFTGIGLFAAFGIYLRNQNKI